MSDHCILVGQTPVAIDPCDPFTAEGKAGLEQWAQWFETNDRRVSRTLLFGGLCEISTVFLGLDHNFHRTITGEGEAILFETMVFWLRGRRTYTTHQERCSTWLGAEAQDKRIARQCRKPWVFLPSLWSALCSEACT